MNDIDDKIVAVGATVAVILVTMIFIMTRLCRRNDKKPRERPPGELPTHVQPGLTVEELKNVLVITINEMGDRMTANLSEMGDTIARAMQPPMIEYFVTATGKRLHATRKKKYEMETLMVPADVSEWLTGHFPEIITQ